MDALISLYRPRVFSEVFGQDYPVRILSQLIKRGQICRNILLYGSVGSGKTTLARIYGKALNCDSPDEDGSPCPQCSSCKKIEEGDPLRFKELDAPLFETLDHFKNTVNIFVSEPLDHRRLIFPTASHGSQMVTNSSSKWWKSRNQELPFALPPRKLIEFQQLSGRAYFQ